MNSQDSVVRFDRAQAALSKVTSALEAKKISDLSKAAEVYAIRQGDKDLQARAHRTHIEALRIEGDWLAVEKNRGGQPKRTGNTVLPVPGRTLKDQGIPKRESATAQAVSELAKREPKVFEQLSAGRVTVKSVVRSRARKKKAKAIAAAQAKPKPVEVNGPYGLVLADPPWRYEHCEADNREIENQYPTASLEDICGHIKNVELARDCVLFLWATAPKLEEALRVLNAWGFNYRSCAVWDKRKIGMGYWFRGQHELLLVGVRGKPGATPESERRSSLFSEARTGHSAKPQCVYEWIERAFPSLAKVELYCRKPRPFWASWGNEC